MCKYIDALFQKKKHFISKHNSSPLSKSHTPYQKSFALKRLAPLLTGASRNQPVVSLPH